MAAYRILITKKAISSEEPAHKLSVKQTTAHILAANLQRVMDGVHSTDASGLLERYIKLFEHRFAFRSDSWTGFGGGDRSGGTGAGDVGGVEDRREGGGAGLNPDCSLTAFVIRVACRQLANSTVIASASLGSSRSTNRPAWAGVNVWPPA